MRAAPGRRVAGFLGIRFASAQLPKVLTRHLSIETRSLSITRDDSVTLSDEMMRDSGLVSYNDCIYSLPLNLRSKGLSSFDAESYTQTSCCGSGNQPQLCVSNLHLCANPACFRRVAYFTEAHADLKV